MTDDAGRQDPHGEEPAPGGESPADQPWAEPEQGRSNSPSFAAPPQPEADFPAGYGQFRESAGKPGAALPTYHQGPPAAFVPPGAGPTGPTGAAGAAGAAGATAAHGSGGAPPTAPPPTGGWGAAQWQPMPAPKPREPRRMPVWGVIVLALVVALGAGAAGGAVATAFQGGTVENPLGSQGADSQDRPPDTIAGVAQEVSPSVVSIQGSDPRGGNGSGFVIEGGYVVTNNHVAAGIGDEIQVIYGDGHESSASVKGSAASSDLAVLEVDDPNDAEPLPLGDSDALTVGDTVIAIGAPLGLDGTVTTGIISAVDRPVTVGEAGDSSYINALQTDAAINPGNSGGPLVNAQGEVIGVNSAIATTGGDVMGQGGSIGLGFAIPSSQANTIIDQLIETGQAQHAVIGAYLDMRFQDGGAMIMEDLEDAEDPAVEPDGPADQAGLEPGDIITEFNGEPVRDADQLIVLIRGSNPGDEVEVSFERDGQEMNTQLTLGTSDN